MSAEEIHAEIQAAKDRQIGDESDYVLAEQTLPAFEMRLYYALPQRVRLFLMRRILANPYRSKDLMATAIITTTAAAGHLAGWVIPKSMHGLCFALGPIAKKPWVAANRVEVRDILHLTVLVDHDVVDGVPAARFFARLVSRIHRSE